MKKRRAGLSFSLTYGIIHALVDASTVMVIYTATTLHGFSLNDAFFLILGYDLLAFGGQVLVGFFSDTLRAPRACARLGIACAGAGLIALFHQPYWAMILAGVGNAFFHVGGGALSLNVRPGRATHPGIFVGPGAIGLAAGIWMGKSGAVFVLPFAVGIIASFAATFLVKIPDVSYERKGAVDFALGKSTAIALLLLFSVAVRAFVGMAGGFELDKTPMVTLWMTLAAFGGKTLGGIVSDRFGWLKVSIGALALSAPLIAFGGRDPALFVLGILLFQMTMPVTLTALAALLPGRSGLAFGLACLALILGAMPTFFKTVKLHYSSLGFLLLIGLSAVVLFVGLKMLEKKIPMRFSTRRRLGDGAGSDEIA